MTISSVSTPTKGTLSSISRKKGFIGDVKVAEMSRGNSITVNPLDLWIEEGFNVRDIDQNHVDDFVKSYTDGKTVAPIEVKLVVVTDEQGNETHKLKVIDGHHRTHELRKAIKNGAKIPTVTVIEFSGNEVDELARMVVSSQTRPLNAIERAKAYARMKKFGLTQTQIANEIHDTPSNVSQLLKLVSAPTELQELIINGEVAINTVHAYVREFSSFDKVLEAVKIDIEEKKERKNKKESGNSNKNYTRSVSSFKKTSLKKKQVQATQTTLVDIARKIDTRKIDSNQTIQLSPEEIAVILELQSKIEEVEQHNSEVDKKLALRAQQIADAPEKS